MAGLRARSLVQKVLSMSRRQEPAVRAMQAQWLQPLIEEEVDLLRATLPREVSLVAHLAGSALSARIDGTQLSQVLMNLGTNAWHAWQGRPGQVEIGLD